MTTAEAKLFNDADFAERPDLRAVRLLDTNLSALPPLLVRAMAFACPLDPSRSDPHPEAVNQWLQDVHQVGNVLAEVDRRDPTETRTVFRMAVAILLDEMRPGWRPDAWGNWGRS